MSGNLYVLIQVAVMSAVTILIRFLPFILFDHGEKPPGWISYLGNVLPPAVMSVLLIYCIRDIDLVSAPHGLPQLIGISAAIGLHAWKGNVLLSICGSTILYMLLIQFIFM